MWCPSVRRLTRLRVWPAARGGCTRAAAQRCVVPRPSGIAARGNAPIHAFAPRFVLAFVLAAGRVAGLAAVLAAPAAAQTVANGSVRGIVRDAQGAVLAGVTLTATSPDAPGVYSTVTDGYGSYRLIDLPPGRYTLTATLDGFTSFTRENIEARAGVNLALDILMVIGSRTETLTVIADTPMLESQSAASAVNVSGAFQRALPMSTRGQWADVLAVVPATVSGDSPLNTTFYTNGAEYSSQVIQIDGADIGPASQSTAAFVPMSASISQDIQVKTAGVDASTPIGQSAVISIVTRSGTDQFRADGRLAVQPRSWSSTNAHGGTSPAFHLAQGDVNAGLPLVRQRAWLFASYRHAQMALGIDRTPEQIAAARALVPGFTPFDNDILSNQVFVKSTTAVTRRDQLTAFVQRGTDDQWLVGPTDTVRSRRASYGGAAAAAHLASTWSRNTTSRVGIAWSGYALPDHLQITDRPGQPVHETVFSSNGVLQGTGAIATLGNSAVASEMETPGTKVTITADVTTHVARWAGTHDLQAGIYVQPWRVHHVTTRYANGGFVTEDLVLREPTRIEAGTIPFHRRVYHDLVREGPNVNSTDLAGYLQDSWRPHPRLTLAAGLRVDAIARRDHVLDVDVQDTVAVGPRLGANYQLSAAGRDIVRLTWGRVHDAASSGSTSGAAISGGYTDSYDLDLDGTFETAIVTPVASRAAVNREVDLAGFRQPHVRELTVGYARQFKRQTTLDVSFVSREFRDRQILLETNGLYEDGRFVGYRREDFNEIYRVTSNTYNWQVFRLAQVQFVHQRGRVQMAANYARQWRHLEGTWQPNDPASFIQPDAFPNDKGIGATSAPVFPVNSFMTTDTFNAMQWRDHVFRLTASWQGWNGIDIATTYAFQSGLWSGPIVERLDAPDPAFGPPLIELPGGRLVQNPLASTLRFAYPTRGEGQLRTDALHGWNLRVGHRRQLKALEVGLAADVFNVLNGDDFSKYDAGANRTFSPTFGQGVARQAPRSFQLLVTVKSR